MTINSITGQEIRILNHNSTFSSFEYWDLRNSYNMEINSGGELVDDSEISIFCNQ